MKREAWIDNLKGIAILAVAADHAIYLFPVLQNYHIWQHTFFSIPWFVFLAGITSTISYREKKWSGLKSFVPYWIRRLKAVVPMYIFASVLIYFYYSAGKFDPAQLAGKLVDFSVQPTYYFVNLLLQLYFVFPFLYSLAVRMQKKWFVFPITLAVFFVSFQLFTVRGNLPWPFYSLGYIFGGNYFFLFFLGILYGKGYFHENKYAYFAAGIIFIAYEITINTVGVFWLRSIGINLIIWSLALLLLAKKATGIFPGQKLFTNTLGFLGRYSLSIYLFHYFFLDLAARLIK